MVKLSFVEIIGATTDVSVSKESVELIAVATPLRLPDKGAHAVGIFASLRSGVMIGGATSIAVEAT